MEPAFFVGWEDRWKYHGRTWPRKFAQIPRRSDFLLCKNVKQVQLSALEMDGDHSDWIFISTDAIWLRQPGNRTADAPATFWRQLQKFTFYNLGMKMSPAATTAAMAAMSTAPAAMSLMFLTRG